MNKAFGVQTVFNTDFQFVFSGAAYETRPQSRQGNRFYVQYLAIYDTDKRVY